MKISSRNRRLWRLVLWLSLGSALISAIYGYQSTDMPLHGIATGIASSLCIATPIILFEIWGHHLAIVRRLRRLSLIAYFGIPVAFYVVIIILGTVASGWLTDVFDPRVLLVAYYAFRGVGLVMLPVLLSDAVHPSMVRFIVIYGLDWVATVPPTAALCREIFGENGTIVFGWVFAAHQIGAAAAALGAGVIRDVFGTYTYAWWGGAALCGVAAVLSIVVRRRPAVPVEAVTAR